GGRELRPARHAAARAGCDRRQAVHDRRRYRRRMTINPRNPECPMYVDGYVVPIVKKHAADYRKVARLACKVWLDHGALEYRECLGDDLNVDMVMPFPKQLKLKRNE